MESKTHCMPLCFVKKGSRVKVIKIIAGCGLTKKLTDLGVIPATELEVLHNSIKGPFVISIKGSRIVIGYGIAEKIMVA
ncbi:MAG: ferrous iron transport protein A [Syntrophorhabdaceae bacterium]|nr:ferrous iron transport protein A [Syntrophorhabdaceae bacterium]